MAWKERTIPFPDLNAVSRDLSMAWTSAVSHGFCLAHVVMSFTTVTSLMHFSMYPVAVCVFLYTLILAIGGCLPEHVSVRSLKAVQG